MKLADGVEHHRLTPGRAPHVLEVDPLAGQGEGHRLQISQAHHDLSDIRLLCLHWMRLANGNRPWHLQNEVLVAVTDGHILEYVPRVHDVCPVGRHRNLDLRAVGPGTKPHLLQAADHLSRGQARSYQVVGLLGIDRPPGRAQVGRDRLTLF